MPRDPSYNQLVAKSREALVRAAECVCGSAWEFNTATAHAGRVQRNYAHRACCSAMNVNDVPELGKHHFRTLFDNGEAYYFGATASVVAAASYRRQEQRVMALLLAAASLE